MPFATLTQSLTGKPASPQGASMTEFIKERLYFTSIASAPVRTSDTHYFTVDQELTYVHFYMDFGPNNMAHVFRFIAIMNAKMESPQLAKKRICLYSSLAPDKRANAAYLISTYMMLIHGQTPAEAYRPLEDCTPALVLYRDAGYGASTYKISVADCLRGLHRAIRKGICKLQEFDLQQYEYYEKVEHGDMNWVLPGKFLAFATPHDETSPDFARLYSPYGPPRARIADTIAYFKSQGITTVVRLNNATYDRQRFLDAGIDHVDMYFPDGSCPPDTILAAFIQLAEDVFARPTPGKIAVHCKAGLGRTGSLIAAYIMKHYHFTASEVIAWLRVIRPGSVVGPQQNYLQAIQNSMWKANLQRSRSSELGVELGLRTKRTSNAGLGVDVVPAQEASDALAAVARVGDVEYSVPAQPRKADLGAIGFDLKRLSVSQQDLAAALSASSAVGDYALTSEGEFATGEMYNLRGKSGAAAAGAVQPDARGSKAKVVT